MVRKKPASRTFFRPFGAECIKLYHEGVQWRDSSGSLQNSRVIFPALIGDAPARALPAHFSQFNGSYGCGKCLHPGERIAQGAGTAQVYPLRYPLPSCRSHEQTLKFAIEADSANSGPVFGVKGLSWLYQIPMFDIVCGIVPEIMHCVFLGVCRQFQTMYQ